MKKKKGVGSKIQRKRVDEKLGKGIDIEKQRRNHGRRSKVMNSAKGEEDIGTEGKTETQTKGETDTERQTDRQTDRQPDRYN